MRAAIYARVSSERQEKEHTIGSQLEALRAYAAKNGMDVVENLPANDPAVAGWIVRPWTGCEIRRSATVLKCC